ncbi:MAG: hypothetical protein KBH10_00170 [Laribacter sp.]|nr:hypothetical protein [Laribacter sp.]
MLHSSKEVLAKPDARLSDKMNRQLQAKGDPARCDQMIDTTLVPVQCNIQARTAQMRIKQDEMPLPVRPVSSRAGRQCLLGG